MELARIRPSAGGPMAKRILVVDDDENILTLERTILEQKGFDVTTVCRRIKEDPKLKDIPVIFLTAKGGGDALAEGFESGAIMYINKPFTANKLLTIVNTMLESGSNLA